MTARAKAATVAWKGNPQLRPFLRPVADLHEDPANARLHPDDNVRDVENSYREFGQQKPIVAMRSGKVLDGNCQLRVAQARLGWSHIATLTFDSEDEARAAAYAIAANRSAEGAQWDDKVLHQTLSRLAGQGISEGGKAIHDDVARAMRRGKGRRYQRTGRPVQNGDGSWDSPEGMGGVRPVDGLAYPGNVLSLGKNREALGHGAAFPVALPDWFIRAYTDQGDRVLDPFMGSGSTLMAVELRGRVGLGMEISPGYCDVVVARWERHTGKKATRDQPRRRA